MIISNEKIDFDNLFNNLDFRTIENNPDFKEDSVREVIIIPILEALGCTKPLVVLTIRIQIYEIMYLLYGIKYNYMKKKNTPPH